MPRVLSLCLLLTCSCVQKTPPIEPSANAASSGLTVALPEASPTPLPPLAPPMRRQSEMERMSHIQLAAWILPADEAWKIVGHEPLRGITGRLNGVALYAQPQRIPASSLCELPVTSVWLRVPNEAGLSPQEHLNPPLEPYQRTALKRWSPARSARCPPPVPSTSWFEAPRQLMPTVH